MEDRQVKPWRALLNDDLQPGLPDPEAPHEKGHGVRTLDGKENRVY